jgi:hypothetical protein
VKNDEKIGFPSNSLTIFGRLFGYWCVVEKVPWYHRLFCLMGCAKARNIFTLINDFFVWGFEGVF